MKKTMIEKIKLYIADCGVTVPELEYYEKINKRPEQLVDEAMFATNYREAFDDMKERYGDDFDASRYYCSDGKTFKYRHNEPYIRIQYRNHLAIVIRKLLKK